MNKSHDYDKILTRLTTILHRLYSGETLHVGELAEEFNVSTKTIQRDFNQRLIRFPIEKAGRGWRMQQGHRLEKVSDIDHLLTLQILETLAEGIGSHFAQRSKALLGKLKNDTPSTLQSHLPIEDITSHGDLFRTLEDAIVEKRKILFVFHAKPRTVHPYRIVNFEGYWYLLGYEEESGLGKKYYIKEIKGCRPLEARFLPDETIRNRTAGALNAWFDPNVEPFEFRLLVKPAIVKYLLRRPLGPTQRIVAEHPDGCREIVLKATTEREALEVGATLHYAAGGIDGGESRDDGRVQAEIVTGAGLVVPLNGEDVDPGQQHSRRNREVLGNSRLVTVDGGGGEGGWGAVEVGTAGEFDAVEIGDKAIIVVDAKEWRADGDRVGDQDLVTDVEGDDVGCTKLNEFRQVVVVPAPETGGAASPRRVIEARLSQPPAPRCWA